RPRPRRSVGRLPRETPASRAPDVPARLGLRGARWSRHRLVGQHRMGSSRAFSRETGVTDGARTRDSWSHNPALYQTELRPPKRAEHSRRKAFRQRGLPLPKSPPIVVATLPTSAAVSNTTPSSRLYRSEPVVKFPDPTYARAPSATIALACT